MLSSLSSVPRRRAPGRRRLFLTSVAVVAVVFVVMIMTIRLTTLAPPRGTASTLTTHHASPAGAHPLPTSKNNKVFAHAVTPAPTTEAPEASKKKKKRRADATVDVIFDAIRGVGKSASSAKSKGDYSAAPPKVVPHMRRNVGGATPSETLAALDGLVGRVFGERYADVVRRRVTFAVEDTVDEQPWCKALHKGRAGSDCVSIESLGGQLTITGATGVAAAWGLHYVMKHMLNSSVQWGLDGTGVQLSETAMAYLEHAEPKDTVWASLGAMSRRASSLVDGSTQEVSAKLGAAVPRRYMYNVCTFGYTTGFWKWPEWQVEIDWLALHGVNLPLALVGQEYVWHKLWTTVYNLTDNDVFDHFTGPAFWPWHWMGNLRKWAGPVTRGYITERRDLQQLILKRMRAFGMSPVLPAFGGHVPEAVLGRLDRIRGGGARRGLDFAEPQQSVDWMGFGGKNTGVFMVDPADPAFGTIGADFMRLLVAEYGRTEYYSADTFNEMPAPTMEESYLALAGKAVVDGIRGGDKEGKWLVQGWIFLHHRHLWSKSRTKAYLDGAGAGNVLVLDLGADLAPMWPRHDRFYGHDFVICMLHSFGGRRGIFGDMPEIVGMVHDGYRKGGANFIGIGGSMEATHHNTALYELLMDLAYAESREATEGDRAAEKASDEAAGDKDEEDVAQAFGGIQLAIDKAPKNTSAWFPWTFTTGQHRAVDGLEPTIRDVAMAWIRSVWVPSRYGSAYGATSVVADSSAIETTLLKGFEALVRLHGPYAHPSTCCPSWTLMAVTPTLNLRRSDLDVRYDPDLIVEAADRYTSALREHDEIALLSDSLRYDTVDLLRQSMENVFTEYVVTVGHVLGEFSQQKADEKRRAQLIYAAQGIFSAMDSLFADVDTVLSADQNFDLHSWIVRAVRWASEDGLTKERMAFNAKNLITSWGDSQGQGYPNYAARSYSGLYKRLYRKRWAAITGEVLARMRDVTSPRSGVFAAFNGLHQTYQVIGALDWRFCTQHTTTDLDEDSPKRMPGPEARTTILRYAGKWLGASELSTIKTTKMGVQTVVSGEAGRDVTFVKCPAASRSSEPLVQYPQGKRHSWHSHLRTAVVMCAGLGATVCGGVDSTGHLYLPANKPALGDCWKTDSEEGQSGTFFLRRMDAHVASKPELAASTRASQSDESHADE